MAVVLLNPKVKEWAKKIVAHAEQSDNWYRPGSGSLPGDDPAHVLHTGTVRAVFSWTSDPKTDRVYRHLSASVVGKVAFPAPEVVWTLARLFGFTGGELEGEAVTKPDDSWRAGINEAEKTIVLVQEVK